MKPLKEGQPDTFFRPASPAYIKGPRTPRCPSVVGKNVDDAKTQLTAAGFTVSVTAGRTPGRRA